MVLHYLRRRLCCQAHNQISCFTPSLLSILISSFLPGISLQTRRFFTGAPCPLSAKVFVSMFPCVLVTPTDRHPSLCCNKHSDCAYLQFESLFEQGGYEQESGEVKLENLKVWFSNSKCAFIAETQAPQFGCAALMWTAEQPRWIFGPGVACQF